MGSKTINNLILNEMRNFETGMRWLNGSTPCKAVSPQSLVRLRRLKHAAILVLSSDVGVHVATSMSMAWWLYISSHKYDGPIDWLVQACISKNVEE